MSFIVGLFESLSKQGPHTVHLVAISLSLFKFEQSALTFFFNAIILLQNTLIYASIYFNTLHPYGRVHAHFKGTKHLVFSGSGTWFYLEILQML